jgi:hypothetical protein
MHPSVFLSLSFIQLRLIDIEYIHLPYYMIEDIRERENPLVFRVILLSAAAVSSHQTNPAIAGI